MQSTTEAAAKANTTAGDAAMQKKNVEASKKTAKPLADKSQKQKAVASTTEAAAMSNTTAADAAKAKANTAATKNDPKAAKPDFKAKDAYTKEQKLSTP